MRHYYVINNVIPIDITKVEKVTRKGKKLFINDVAIQVKDIDTAKMIQDEIKHLIKNKLLLLPYRINKLVNDGIISFYKAENQSGTYFENQGIVQITCKKYNKIEQHKIGFDFRQDDELLKTLRDYSSLNEFIDIITNWTQDIAKCFKIFYAINETPTRKYKPIGIIDIFRKDIYINKPIVCFNSETADESSISLLDNNILIDKEELAILLDVFSEKEGIYHRLIKQYFSSIVKTLKIDYNINKTEATRITRELYNTYNSKYITFKKFFKLNDLKKILNSIYRK